MFRILVVILLILHVACNNDQTSGMEGVAHEVTGDEFSEKINSFEKTHSHDKLILLWNALKAGDIGSLREISKAPESKRPESNSGEFCESLVANICNSTEVSDYMRVKSVFESLGEYIYQFHTKNLLEEFLGSPADRENVEYWICEDLILEQPKGIGDNEIYEKYRKCEKIRSSAIQETLFPQQTREKMKKLFQKTKNHIIDNLNEMIALEGNYPKKIEKLSIALNEIFKTRMIFSQDKPYWNTSAHKSETIVRAEGMALLADIDSSYLTGVMYHEFGHIINPSRFFSNNYVNRENVPFYTSLSCLKDNGFARPADLSCYQNRLLICDQEQKFYCNDMKSFVDSYSIFPMISYEGPTHLSVIPLFEPCQNDQTGEAFSDLVMAEMLAWEMIGSSVEENRSKVKKHLAHLCYEFQKSSDMSLDKRVQLNLGTYPDGKLRLDLVLNHPGIRKAIGCKPVQTGEKSFCELSSIK